MSTLYYFTLKLILKTIFILYIMDHHIEDLLKVRLQYNQFILEDLLLVNHQYLNKNFNQGILKLRYNSFILVD